VAAQGLATAEAVVAADLAVVAAIATAGVTDTVPVAAAVETDRNSRARPTELVQDQDTVQVRVTAAWELEQAQVQKEAAPGVRTAVVEAFTHRKRQRSSAILAVSCRVLATRFTPTAT
jgi:hypothetical protein